MERLIEFLRQGTDAFLDEKFEVGNILTLIAQSDLLRANFLSALQNHPEAVAGMLEDYGKDPAPTMEILREATERQTSPFDAAANQQATGIVRISNAIIHMSHCAP